MWRRWRAETSAPGNTVTGAVASATTEPPASISSICTEVSAVGDPPVAHRCGDRHHGHVVVDLRDEHREVAGHQVDRAGFEEPDVPVDAAARVPPRVPVGLGLDLDLVLASTEQVVDGDEEPRIPGGLMAGDRAVHHHHGVAVDRFELQHRGRRIVGGALEAPAVLPGPSGEVAGRRAGVRRPVGADDGVVGQGDRGQAGPRVHHLGEPVDGLRAEAPAVVEGCPAHGADSLERRAC